MKKILTFLAVFTLILLPGFSKEASASSDSVNEVENQVFSQVQPSSIYDNATVIKPYQDVNGKTTRFTTTRFYKVNFENHNGYPLMFYVSSEYRNHEIYVYDENYLSVGRYTYGKSELTVDNPRQAWYYIEIRQVGPQGLMHDSPFKLMHGW